MELRSLKRCCSSLKFLLVLCLALFDTKHRFQAVSSSEVNHFPSPNDEAFENPEYEETPQQQIFPIGHLFPLEGPELESYKRSSSFFPLRGKKPSSVLSELLEEGDPESKRGSHFFPLRGKKFRDGLKRASSFMPMRGRKNDDDLSAHDDEKRASSFMPMRGKKRDGRLGKSGTYPNDAVSHVRYRYVSERPVGQMNDLMHGHVDLVDPSNVFDHAKEEAVAKKQSVPSYSVRRRRGVQDGGSETGLGIGLEKIPGSIATGLVDKKASSFMPMRGRKDGRGDLGENDTDNDEADVGFEAGDLYGENIFKRASSFMPMRGRKNNWGNPEDELPTWNGKMVIELTKLPTTGHEKFHHSNMGLLIPVFPKRLSFVPMRGRRLMDASGLQWSHDELIPHQQSMAKRTSFLPMSDQERLSGMGDISAFYGPYPFILSGMGSSLMQRPYGVKKGASQALRGKKRRLKINWDSVKRAFHAARGKRVEEEAQSTMADSPQGMPGRMTAKGSPRLKRSIVQSRLSSESQEQYIALKRPMSFFATRGKRMDGPSTN